MKLSQVTVLGVSALFSLAAFATEPTATKTEGTPVAKAEGHTCEKCTKEGKKCECKGECKCDHKGHSKKDAKKADKAAATTPAAPTTADATTTPAAAAPTTEKK